MRKALVWLFLFLIIALTVMGASVRRRAGVEDLRYGTTELQYILASGDTLDVHGFTPHNVMAFGVEGDGATDDTDSLTVLFNAVNAAGGGAIYFPPGTYLTDGTQLTIGSNTVIYGHGATLKLKAGSLTSNAHFFGTRITAGYSADSTYSENVVIQGLKFDGNAANITEGSYGCNAIFAHQVRDWVIRDCEIVDLPGVSGTTYGIIFWYSDRVRVEDCHINRTDRQNIMIWETTAANIENCVLRGSYFREPIAIGSNSPATLQASWANVSGCDIVNQLASTEYSRYGIRFSGEASGSVTNSLIRGDIRGIYITDVYEKKILIDNCKVWSDSVGIEVASNVDRDITISNCAIDSCKKGIYVNAASGRVRIVNNKITNSTDIPLNVAYPDFVIIEDNYIDTGTYVLLRPTRYGLFDGNIVTNMTSASYAVQVQGSDTSRTYIRNNIIAYNATDYIYSLQGGYIANNLTDSIRGFNAGVDFNIYDFGANGVATNNDSAAIAYAIDAAEFNGGGDVRFPFDSNGYIIGSNGITISDNDVRLVGAGIPDSISGGAPRLLWGSGTPEGDDWGPVGSIFQRKDGASGTAAYVKTVGDDDAGWVALVDKNTQLDSMMIAAGDTSTDPNTGTRLIYIGDRLYFYDNANDVYRKITVEGD